MLHQNLTQKLKKYLLQLTHETAWFSHSVNMWEDIFCCKQMPLEFMNHSQFGIKPGC